jgi:cell wall assembly regulator SMI1
LYDTGEFKNLEPEPDAGIQKAWWHPAWIPVTYDGVGNHDCIDLAPADTDGQSGQLLRLWHDDALRYLVADDFAQWVDFYVEDLEAGLYVYLDNVGIWELEDENDGDH